MPDRRFRYKIMSPGVQRSKVIVKKIAESRPRGPNGQGSRTELTVVLVHASTVHHCCPSKVNEVSTKLSLFCAESNGMHQQHATKEVEAFGDSAIFNPSAGR
jgi:hypothetical protein